MYDKLVIFDWSGVVEPRRTYKKNWDMIGKICGIDSTDLKATYFSDPSRERITDKHEFLKMLEDMTSGFDMKYPSGVDEMDLVKDTQEFPRGRFLFDVYESVCATIPYRKDIAALISKLPEHGIHTALLSDAGIWDLKRQNKQMNLSSCSFVWRSCQMKDPKGSKKYGDIFAIAKADIETAGFDSHDVLYIDDNEEYLKTAAIECGWNTYLDEDCESAAGLIKVIQAQFGSIREK